MNRLDNMIKINQHIEEKVNIIMHSMYIRLTIDTSCVYAKTWNDINHWISANAQIMYQIKLHSYD